MLQRFILPRADVGSGITPSSGAKLFFYEPGTSNFKDTFTDVNGIFPSTNPVIANEKGVFDSIYLSGVYKVILQDKNGSQIWEESAVQYDYSFDSASEAALVEFAADGEAAIDEFNDVTVPAAIAQGEQDFADQRDQFDATFTAQFAYKRIGNISGYAGQQLQEVDKLNSYQFPDDSGEWYGPIQSQTFPITIPADPSSSQEWGLTNALTTTSGDERYKATFKNDTFGSAVDNMISGRLGGVVSVAHEVGNVYSTGGTSWRVETTLNSSIDDFIPLSIMAPNDFGVNTTIDDTEHCRRLHDYANSIGHPVNYSGISVLNIQNDADITVNTSTDFCNATLNVLNGIIPPEDFVFAGGINKVFAIRDDSTPLITGLTNTYADYSNIGLNSDVAFLGVESNCHIELFGDISIHQLPARSVTSTTPIQPIIPMYIDKYGNNNPTLPFGFDGGSLSVAYSKRLDSLGGRLLIENLVINTSTYNNASVIFIERNNVRVLNISDVADGVETVTRTNNVNVYAYHVSNVEFDEFYMDGSNADDNGELKFTYVISFENSSNLLIKSLVSNGQWGVTAGNYVSNIVYRDCSVNRIDIHVGFYNLSVIDCNVRDFIQYGSGYGRLRVIGGSHSGNGCVRARGIDYGGSLQGSIDISDCTLKVDANKYTAVDVVKLSEGTGLGSDSAVVYTPDINISNIAIESNTGSNTLVVRIVNAEVRADSTFAVIAPAQITITNVKARQSNTAFSVAVDYANMDGLVNNGTSTISVYGVVSPNNSAFLTLGTNARAIANAVRLNVVANDSTFGLSTAFKIYTAHIVNCQLRELDFPSSREVNIVSSTFAKSGTYTLGTGDNGSMFMSSCVFAFSSVIYDLSALKGIIGTSVTSAVVLPPGATVTTAFTGFRI